MSRIFERNGVLKIISVIIAIILWLYATSELNPEIPKELNGVPIDIINHDTLEDNNLILVYDPANTIDLKLRGLTSDIRRIQPDKVKAILDLSEAEKEGVQKIRLKVEGLPREVRFDAVPETTININTIVSKEIPVEVMLVGREADGYYHHQPVSDTESIIINGPESLVTKVAQGIIQMNIEDIKTPLEQSLQIILLDSSKRQIESRYIKKQKEYAIGTVLIYPEKSLSIKPNIIGTPAMGYEVTSIEVEPEKITVNGEPEVINSKIELETDSINIDGKTADINTTVGIKHEGLHINPKFDDEARVVIRINERHIEKTVTVDALDFINEPEDYDIEWNNKPFKVVLSGRYTVVTNLTAQSIALSVDLKERKPGSHRLPVIVSRLPEGVDAQVEPSTIMVTIKEREPDNIDNVPVEPTQGDDARQDQQEEPAQR